MDYNSDLNTWEVTSSYYVSTGYSNPEASGGYHNKIDDFSTDKEFLYSPPINCLLYTRGILRMGMWRLNSYRETLYVSVDNDKDGLYDDFIKAITINDTPPAEKWGLSLY